MTVSNTHTHILFLSLSH